MRDSDPSDDVHRLLDRDRISRFEFEVCWHHSQRQAKEQES
jgi:hypothetical protein